MLAVEADLPLGSPISASYWTKDNNHCTSGCSLELYCVSSSLCRTLLSVIGANRVAIWTESHDFRNEIFFLKKYFI